MSALPHPNSISIGRSETTSRSETRTETGRKIAWYTPVYWVLGLAAVAIGAWAIAVGEVSGIGSVVAGILTAVLGGPATRTIVTRFGGEGERGQ